MTPLRTSDIFSNGDKSGLGLGSYTASIPWDAMLLVGGDPASLPV